MNKLPDTPYWGGVNENMLIPAEPVTGWKKFFLVDIDTYLKDALLLSRSDFAFINALRKAYTEGEGEWLIDSDHKLRVIGGKMKLLEKDGVNFPETHLTNYVKALDSLTYKIVRDGGITDIKIEQQIINHTNQRRFEAGDENIRPWKINELQFFGKERR